MASVFIKVPVSERPPNEEGNYYTDLGYIYFKQEIKLWYDDENDYCYPNYWLEEIELPTDEEILGATLIKQDKDQTQFMRGIDFILNKLKGGL